VKDEKRCKKGREDPTSDTEKTVKKRRWESGGEGKECTPWGR
jgi:hypothetical protein